jgi:ribokinase
MAAARGVGVVLNPAPAQTLAPALLKFLSIITPNEVEAEMLTGIKIADEKSWAAAAQALRACGVATAMITLGSQGVFVATAHQRFLVPAFKVEAVDTTAAGDVFNGALAAFLSRDRTIGETVSLASAAAALSVTKLGAQASAPFLHEIQNFLSHAPSPVIGC